MALRALLFVIAVLVVCAATDSLRAGKRARLLLVVPGAAVLFVIDIRLLSFLLVTYIAGVLVLGSVLGLGLSLLLGQRVWFSARQVLEPAITLERADGQPASEQELSSFYARWANRWFISGSQAFAIGVVAASYQTRWPPPDTWMGSAWQAGWLFLAVTLRGFAPALAIPAIAGFWLSLTLSAA